MNTHSNGPVIITFASPKGGVGKSTNCAALAGALAHRGFPVHVLDLDQTQTLARWFARNPNATPGLKVEAVPEDGFMERMRELWAKSTGFILVDVAGSFGKTMIQAATASHLTITPTKLSEPDIVQAAKLHREITDLAAMIGKQLTHRILINEVSPLLPTYQRAALAEVERIGTTRFQNLIHARAPYAEIFLTGQTPHFADRSREPVRKAVVELDALTDEVLALLGINMKEAA